MGHLSARQLDQVTAQIESIVQDAFAQLELPEGIEVVDKLRDIDFQEFEPDGAAHFTGSTFASCNDDGEQDDSFRLSFHCIIDSNKKVQSAYAYDCRTGIELAALAA